MSTAQKRIAGAFFVGFGMITAALLLPQSKPPAQTETGLKVVAESVSNRNMIAVSDQDSDGIPDWQEALQRTEPVVIDEVESDYEIPDTLTDRFAIDFFQDMVRSENYGAFGSSPEELVTQATDALDAEAQDELYGVSDINISTDVSPAAVRTYANTLAQIVLDYTLPADAPTEIEILKRAYDTNNPEVLTELDPYVKSYTAMVDRFAVVRVPSNYTVAHMDLLNAFNAVRNDIAGFQKAFSDPLYTMIRLKRFEEDVAAMHITILNLQLIITEAQVPFEATDPVMQLLTPLNNVGQ